jgi:hypothetical protein
MPLSGSWFGNSGDYLGMEVKVALRKLASLPEFDDSVDALVS